MQTPAMGQFVTVQLVTVGNPTMLASRLHYKAMRPFHPVTHCAREPHSTRRYLCYVGTPVDVTATVG